MHPGAAHDVDDCFSTLNGNRLIPGREDLLDGVPELRIIVGDQQPEIVLERRCHATGTPNGPSGSLFLKNRAQASGFQANQAAAGHHPANAENTSEMFCPPNPKLLESAFRTFPSRAALGM